VVTIVNDRIKFTVPKVINYLRKNGEVYTIRKPRSEGIADVYFGDKLVAIAYVKRVGFVGSKGWLMKFVRKSGFDSVDEWLTVAKRLHRNRSKLVLYHVKIVKWFE